MIPYIHEYLGLSQNSRIGLNGPEQYNLQKMMPEVEDDILQTSSFKVFNKIKRLLPKIGDLTSQARLQLAFIPHTSSMDKGCLQMNIKLVNTSVILQAFAVKKISCDIASDGHHYINLTHKFNEKMLGDELVFWVEQNKNFGIKKIIPLTLFQEKQANIQSQLLSYIKQLQNKLFFYINLAIKQKPSCWKQKNVVNIEKLKYQFEVNRRKRKNATSFDFNNSRIKGIRELIQIRHKCTRQGKNYLAMVRERLLKNPIDGKQAQIYYRKVIQQEQKQAERTKIVISNQQKLKILNSIKIKQSKLSNKQLIESNPHIKIYESVFQIILSLNLLTSQFINNHIQIENKESTNIKQIKCQLVQKSKCIGCAGQTQIQIIRNQSSFHNQTEILVILNQYMHPSICAYYTQPYDKYTKINSIFSKRYYSNPTAKFYYLNKITTRLKHIVHVLMFLLELASGIAFLLDLGIIHRDLKPTNILLDEKGSCKIIDFGSACPVFGSPLESRISKSFSLELRSTKGFYSRYSEICEQVRGKYTKDEYNRHPAFDIYSLGAIAEFLLPCFSNEDQDEGQETLQACLDYLIRKWKDINPDDRISAHESIVFLKQLIKFGEKLVRLRQDCQS